MEPVIEFRKQAETQSPHWHCIRVFESHTAREIALSGDGTIALSGEQEAATLKLWEVSTGRILRSFQEEYFVNAVAMSTDGCMALSASNYTLLKCWSLESPADLTGLYRAPVFLWYYPLLFHLMANG